MSVTLNTATETTDLPDPVGETPRRRVTIGPFLEKYALVIALVAVVAVFSLLRPEVYPTASNLQNVLGSQAVLLILALGLIVPLTAGEFDLSSVSTMSLSAMTIAVLNVQHDWSPLSSIAIALLAALLVGLINAVLVARLQIDSFIATLGSGTVVLGVVQWISHSTSVTGIDSALVDRLAGIVYAGMLGGADPSSGQSFMLPAFGAAFLGATAIIPGRFNAFGTLIAVYFLVAGVVGLQMLGAASFVQQLFYGGALIVAVALSGAVRRRTASRSAA